MANSFWQREKGMKKMNSTVLFSRFGKPENFGKLFGKGRRIRRSSKKFRNQIRKVCSQKKNNCTNANQSLAFIDSSSLVNKTIGRVITFRKSENRWKSYNF